jgi:arylsulfatase
MKLTFSKKLPAAWKALAVLTVAALSAVPALAAKPIAHDAEFYVLQEQNGERWAQEDKTLDATLAEFREKNGGKPPNIVYILIDDIGFGDLGS